MTNKLSTGLTKSQLISEREILDRDIFIIIGAGASFGHSINRGSCPPLGKDLGKELRDSYQEFRNVEEQISIQCGEDFEEWLEKLGDKPFQFTDVLWCISKYFSKYHHLPSDSAYLKLIDVLGSYTLKKVIFVSLNYESLLEMSLRKRGYGVIAGTAEYDSFNSTDNRLRAFVPIFKPHGSSTYRVYLRVKIENCKRMAICDPSSNISLGPVFLCDPKKAHEEMESIERSIPSVISAYNPTKSTSFNREFIDYQREKLLQLISKSSKVIVVGINHREEDEYINKLIEAAFLGGSELGFIGSLRAYEGYVNHCKIKSSQPKGFTRIGGRFQESILDIKRFLSSKQSTFNPI